MLGITVPPSMSKKEFGMRLDSTKTISQELIIEIEKVTDHKKIAEINIIKANCQTSFEIAPMTQIQFGKHSVRENSGYDSPLNNPTSRNIVFNKHKSYYGQKGDRKIHNFGY